MWGSDPVHPSEDAHGFITRAIKEDILNSKSRYTNPPKVIGEPSAKSPKFDLATFWQDWVEGCSAILPRRDTVSEGGGGR
jgi:hypothetical protein